MAGILTYRKALEEELEYQRDRMKKIHAHSPLFLIATEYGREFTNNIGWDHSTPERQFDITYAWGTGVINAVALNLRLGEQDTITKDVWPIVEEIMEDPRLEFKEDCEYIEMGWKGWNFLLRTANGNNDFRPTLKIRAWFEKSIKCKKVGTGKFEEVMEVVCEE